MRKCKKCEQVKDESNFYKDRGRLRLACKQCCAGPKKSKIYVQGMKECTTCKSVKSLNDFYRQGAYRMSTCRDCIKKRSSYSRKLKPRKEPIVVEKEVEVAIPIPPPNIEKYSLQDILLNFARHP